MLIGVRVSGKRSLCSGPPHPSPGGSWSEEGNVARGQVGPRGPNVLSVHIARGKIARLCATSARLRSCERPALPKGSMGRRWDLHSQGRRMSFRETHTPV